MFHDFSPVLTRDDDSGWPILLKRIEESDKACRGGAPPAAGAACPGWRRRRLLRAAEEGTQGDGDGEGYPGVRAYYGDLMRKFGI